MSNYVDGLYLDTRRARKAGDTETAAKKYAYILAEGDPGWEPAFYAAFYRAGECTINQIAQGAQTLFDALNDVFTRIVKTEPDEASRLTAAREVACNTRSLVEALRNSADDYFNGIDLQLKSKYENQYINQLIGLAKVLYQLGNDLDIFFKGTLSKEAVEIWKLANKYSKVASIWSNNKQQFKDIIGEYTGKIQKYDASYVPPEVKIAGPFAKILTALITAGICALFFYWLFK